MRAQSGRCSSVQDSARYSDDFLYESGREREVRGRELEFRAVGRRERGSRAPFYVKWCNRTLFLHNSLQFRLILPMLSRTLCPKYASQAGGCCQ